MKIIEKLDSKKILWLKIAITLIIVVIFAVFINSIFSKNIQLSEKLSAAQDLHSYLLQIENKVQANKIFTSISAIKAKKIIAKNFSYNKISIIENKIKIYISKQSFAKIIDSLQQLKKNYGISVTTATINKVAEGVVNAQLIFSLP